MIAEPRGGVIVISEPEDGGSSADAIRSASKSLDESTLSKERKHQLMGQAQVALTIQFDTHVEMNIDAEGTTIIKRELLAHP